MINLSGKMQGGQPLPPRPSVWQVITGLIGGALGIGIIAYLTQASGLPLIMAPFGATCVLLFAAPDSPLAQPRNVIGGHFVASFVGIFFIKYIGVNPLCMGLAVGVAIALMQLMRVVHPPAGANPLVILLAGSADWSFLLTPVLASSIVLVLVALMVNNVGKSRNWPKYWA